MGNYNDIVVFTDEINISVDIPRSIVTSPSQVLQEYV